jgi:hypothetical protein
MKILLLSEGRTGSYSVMEWIVSDLKLEIVGEKEPCDYTEINNVIVKRTLSNEDFNLKNVKYFDKVIILYREDTLEQAQSSLWAVLKNKWHHNPNTNDGFYSIDDDFLIQNHNQIWDIKHNLDKLLVSYKSIDYGLKISYENIFINKTGQKILEDYIGFKSTTTLAVNKNKLRINNIKNKIV